MSTVEKFKTYPRVIELIKEEAEKAGSLNSVVKKTGLTHNTITNYKAGRSEPTQKSLKKIGDAYGKSVAWLREDVEKDPPIPANMIDISYLSPAKRKLWDAIQSMPEEKAKALLSLIAP